ncbi:hypothetical protein pb186bvf_006595 [Paramecium bursaria]
MTGKPNIISVIEVFAVQQHKMSLFEKAICNIFIIEQFLLLSIRVYQLMFNYLFQRLKYYFSYNRCFMDNISRMKFYIYIII